PQTRAGGVSAGPARRTRSTSAMAAVRIDLVQIERVERALERRPQLAQRLFTDGERAYAASRARPGQHLAARFAAKEAVAKALELPALIPHEVEIASQPPGAPQARLHGSAAARARGLGVEVA